jgi:hypothetical protein
MPSIVKTNHYITSNILKKEHSWGVALDVIYKQYFYPRKICLREWRKYVISPCPIATERGLKTITEERVYVWWL